MKQLGNYYYVIVLCIKIHKNNSSDIQWVPAAPDGGRRQNFVALRTRGKDFNDLEYNAKVCVSCDILRSTVFTLRGSCEDSYLELEYFPTICKGYIGFRGNRISIW